VVSRERLEEKRDRLLNGRINEFECIYTIHLRSDADTVLALLAEFGESPRPYLNPRWVNIRRSGGEPRQTGCVIEYRIFGGLISFSIVQQSTTDENLVQYQVRDGFAHGGTFLFQVEPGNPGHCLLTVYLAFDYARGESAPGRVFWWTFRQLFPEFIHEVLWNHALCEFKQAVEATDLEKEPELIDYLQL
jgi:hypothetical protein